MQSNNIFKLPELMMENRPQRTARAEVMAVIRQSSATFSGNMVDNQKWHRGQLAATIDDRIEPYPFTETTFTINNPLAYEIQRYGIRLYPRESPQAA